MPRKRRMSRRPDTEAERRARVFVHENAPLIDEGGVSTLERIVVQGSPIVGALSDETVEVGKKLENATYALADAINDPKTPPMRVHKLEMERDGLKKAYDETSAACERCRALWEHALEA